jgi:hypothetical protein
MRKGALSVLRARGDITIKLCLLDNYLFNNYLLNNHFGLGSPEVVPTFKLERPAVVLVESFC